MRGVAVILIFIACIRAQYDGVGDDNDPVGLAERKTHYLNNGDDEIHYDAIHDTRDHVTGGDYRATVLSQSTVNSNFTTIRCRNYKDFYTLLYSLCLHSTLCSERYYLDTSVLAPTSEHTTAYYQAVAKINFKKFVYRIALKQLFIIRDVGTNNTNDTTRHLFILADRVPLQWIPPFVIALTHNKSDHCSQSVDLLAAENTLFVHSSQYLLHIYSVYVRNDYECADPNEWMDIDSNNKSHCHCRQGKSCANEATYTTLAIVLSVVIILLVVGNIVSFFTNTSRLVTKIDEANRLKMKQA